MAETLVLHTVRWSVWEDSVTYCVVWVPQVQRRTLGNGESEATGLLH